MVRALVKDSTDNGTAPDMQTFLDSDGKIGQLVRNATSPALQEGASLLQARAPQQLLTSALWESSPSHDTLGTGISRLSELSGRACV